MNYTLLISCRDRTGIVAALSSLLARVGGNILDADQHSEPAGDVLDAAGETQDDELPTFFMRLAFDASAMTVTPAALGRELEALSEEYAMAWSLHGESPRARVAVMCSKTPHCLYDLLVREAMGELPGEVVVVISNHWDLQSVAEHFGKPFHHVAVMQERKAQAEQRQQAILADAGADVLVLARYMQVLSKELSASWAGRCINIHHSFLPAFVGARPYHQAKRRGVKIIGATAHYVTAELDQGPIIEQDVTRVTHRDGVSDLIRKGRDLERQVLATAVRLHLERRVLIHGRRTIVFR